MDWTQDEPWGMKDSVRIFVYVFDHTKKLNHLFIFNAEVDIVALIQSNDRA